MLFKFIIFYCALSVINDTCAHPKTEDGQHQQANPLDAFQKNLEMFKNCIDQSLAKAVDQVNEKQLQPVLGALGDSLNRVSKAFDDLTATTKGYEKYK